ncbi:integration host factor subunit beta [Rhizobium sp. BK060]|uniref:integration host factor subunit beta n=1 Tax=Rhizobium sp. BK060 TaxID=2587096 RepID=UPI00161F7152|nr:integration host factor subunit beta [Rhizobium sp. BK060]
MIKSELVSLIASRNPHLYHNDAERIVDTILDEIAETLAQGGRVELRGFGVFSVRNRRSRSGRNPSNGTPVFVEEKWIPFFRPGKDMQERLNPSGEE